MGEGVGGDGRLVWMNTLPFVVVLFLGKRGVLYGDHQ